MYELLFRLMLLCLVNRCQGNCGEKLFPGDKEVYLVFKSRKRISFVSNHGEVDSKYCPLYIYFKAECLKKYERHIHDIHYDVFPFMQITFGKDRLARLVEEVEPTLKKLVWMRQIIKSEVFWVSWMVA